MNKKQIFSTLTNDPALSLTTALPKGDMIITFYDLNLKNQSAPSNHTFSFIHFTTAKHHLSLFMFSLYSITWLNKQGCVSGTVLGTSYKHIQSSTLCSKYGCHPSFTDEDAGAQRGDGSSARGQAGGAQSCSARVLSRQAGLPSRSVQWKSALSQPLSGVSVHSSR